jgi:cell division protein FtsI (penicillin-binding protein 3)
MRQARNTQTIDTGSRWIRLRVTILGAVFLLALCGIFARAVVLQVHQNGRLKGFAEDQYLRAMDIPARRGDIVDRRNAALAQSVDVDSVWVDPSMLPSVKEGAKALAKALQLDPRELTDKLGRARRFAWVKRQISPGEYARVNALGLPGLGFAKEPRRFYPQRELAAHLVGLVGTDSNGLDGLELSFEDELSGATVKREGFRDAKGRKLLTNGIEDPLTRQGASMTLTIDSQIQHVTEQALSTAVTEAKAVAGIAVVLDPKTGEILALANAPRFNPNSPSSAPKEALRNRAVTDLFEPGSTFKAFSVAAAIDANVITEDTDFDCEKGRFVVGRNVVHDTHPHGVLKPRGILQVSSNIGAAKIAQKLGRSRLTEAYARFGFGERYGLGLPGEGKGFIPTPRSDIALATQSFGQGLNATAVQVAAAYGALANGGVLMKPYVVSRVVDPDGVALLENKPTPIRRVVSEKTARSVVSMLESVVEPGGTAPKARLAEYRVAGKTGTAQKVDLIAGGYSDKRLASFVGMVPANDPRVVILIFIDEPKTDVYGGLVAAPAFAEIATQIVPKLGVPASRVPLLTDGVKPLEQKPRTAKNEKPEKSIAVSEKLDQMEAVTDTMADGVVRVPDVGGLSGRVAIAKITDVALEPHLAGSGRVVTQHPSAGSLVEKGTRVTLELAGQLPPPPR